MNDKVDTRVVRMEFDNKQFEKNVKQTSKSLNDLKQNLDFKGVGDSLDKVRVKISALEVAATTFVVNLTNRLITLGVTITKSLSVDNIASGWEKFGNKTVSVATMMAQKIRIAGREITDMAEQTEIVNKQLELLTWFADETSYSFTDMVDNVGKFIAAGQDLDTSVKAMEGIANWAALSGQNAQTASRAMYQLAQALGKGKVALQDWMSIQNANMDTEEFRATILATAVAMGKLTQEGDKFITKTGKKFTQSEFTKYLSEGWFTSDVLVAGLGKYSAAVEQIYALANRDGITASEVIEKYGDQLDEFGVKAFKAAQEARTFTDVLNSIKDAVSSKWMTTFEEIFGGKDESIKTWTELANELYDVFAESGNFRNNMLSIWSDMGGRNDIFGKHGDPNQGAFWNLYDAIIAVKDLIASAWNTIFPISEMEDENDRAKSIARTLKNLTEILKRATEQWKNNAEQATLLRKIFEGLFSILRLGLVTIQAIRYVIEPVFDTLKKLASQILNRIVSLTGGLDNVLMGIVRAAEYLRSRIEDIIEIINPSNVLNSVFSVLKNVWAVIKEINPIERLFSLIENIFKGIQEGGGTVANFSKIIKNVLKIASSLISIVLSIASALSRYLLPILQTITDVIGYLSGFLVGIVTEAISIVTDILSVIDDLFKGTGSFEELGSVVRDFLLFLPKALNAINPILAATIVIIKSLVEAIFAIPKILDAISVKLTGKGILDNLTEFFGNFSSIISSFVDGIKGGSSSGEIGTMQGLIDAFSYLFKGLSALIKGLIASAQALITVLGAALQTLGNVLKYISTIIIKVFTGKWDELSKKTKFILKALLVLGILIGLFIAIRNMFWRLIAAINPLGTVADSLSGVLDKFAGSQLVVNIQGITLAILEVAVALYIFQNVLGKINKNLLAVLGILISVVGILLLVRFAIKDFTGGASLIGKELSRSIDEIKESAKNAKKKDSALSQISDILDSIGKAILKIALAALIFDRIKNPEVVFGALYKILGFLVALTGSLAIIMTVLDKRIKKVEGNRDSSLTKLALMLAATITAIKLVVKILSQLGGMDAETLKRGGLALGLITIGLLRVIASIILLSKFGGTAFDGKKAGMFILSIGAVFAAMAILYAIMSRIPIDSMLATTVALSVLLGAITGMMLLLSRFSGNKFSPKKAAVFMVSIGVVFTSMAASFAIMKDIPVPTLIASTVAIATLLAAITSMILLLSKLTGNKFSPKKAAVFMVSIGVVFLSIMAAFSALSKSSVGNIIASTLAISTLLAAVTAMIVLLSRLTGNKFSAEKAAVFAVSIGTALLGIATALSIISKLPVANMLASVLAISVLLGVLTGMVILLSKFAGGEGGSNAVTILIGISAAVLMLSVALYVMARAIDILAEKSDQIAVVFYAIGAGVASFFAGFLESLGPVIEAALTLFETYVPRFVETVLNVINSILQAVAENIGPILEKIFSILHIVLVSLTEKLPTLIEDVVNFIFAIVDAIIPLLPQILLKVWNAIMSLLGQQEMTEEEAQQLFQPFMDAIGSIIEIIKDLLAEIGPALKEFFNAIREVLKAINPIITAIINVITDFIKAIDWEVITKIITTLLGFIGTILGVIADVLNTVFEILSPIIETIVKVLSPILKVIGELLKTIFSLLEPFIPILEAIFKVVGAIVKVGIELINGFFKGIKEGWSKAWEGIQKVFGGFLNWIKKLFGIHSPSTVFAGYGDNIIVGLKNGLEESSKKNEKGIKGVFSKIGNWFKEKFGIKSPSKVFAEYGEYMMAGLAIGLDDGVKEQRTAMQNTLSTLSSSLEDYLDVNEDDITIKVGMDISGVEEQSKNVRGIMSSISNYSGSISGAYGASASNASGEINRVSAAKARALAKAESEDHSASSYTDNTTNNNVFNIQSSKPKEVAEEVDKILQERVLSKKLARGGI